MQSRLGLDLEVADEFGIGFAWYVTGEGCFMANIWKIKRRGHKQLYTKFTITIRADDIDGLRYIQQTLGVGHVTEHPNPTGGNPRAYYNVTRIADLYHVIVPLFEKYSLPPQWRKARDFEIWKQIVHIQYQEGGHRASRFRGGTLPTNKAFWDKVEPLVQQLKRSRKFCS